MPDVTSVHIGSAGLSLKKARVSARTAKPLASHPVRKGRKRGRK